MAELKTQIIFKGKSKEAKARLTFIEDGGPIPFKYGNAPKKPIVCFEFPVGTTLNEAKNLLTKAFQRYIQPFKIKEARGEEYKTRQDFLLARDFQGSAKDHRKVLMTHLEAYRKLPGKTAKDLQEERKREASKEPRANRSKARQLSRACYLWIRSQWRSIMDGTGSLPEKKKSLGDSYELVREANGWPVIGEVELYRIARCASLKTASQTFRKPITPRKSP